MATQESTLARSRAIISEKTQRKAALLALESVFVLSVVYLSRFPFDLDALTILCFILATLRLARAISYNTIGEVIRAPFTVVEPDSCGAGENVNPAGSGARRVLGELISCPICTGQWSALGLYALYVLTPYGRTAVLVLAFAGGFEFIHWFAELLEWSGRAARVYSGKISPDKR